MGSNLQQWRAVCGGFHSKLTSFHWTPTSRGGFISERSLRAKEQWENPSSRSWVFIALIITIMINAIDVASQLDTGEVKEQITMKRNTVTGGVIDGFNCVSILGFIIWNSRSDGRRVVYFFPFYLFLFQLFTSSSTWSNDRFTPSAKEIGGSIPSLLLDLRQEGHTKSIPLSKGLIATMLAMAGIETNPGPTKNGQDSIEQSCKKAAHHERSTGKYAPNLPKQPKKNETLQVLKKLQEKFADFYGWKQMRETVFMVGTEDRDIDWDIRMSNILINKKYKTFKPKKKEDINDEIRKGDNKYNKQLEYHVHLLSVRAEITVSKTIAKALYGMPALVIHDVKFFTHFQESNALFNTIGINLKSYHRQKDGKFIEQQIDTLVIYPSKHRLCIRIIETKNQGELQYPWDNVNNKRFKDRTAIKAMKQLSDNVMEFFAMFPDVNPDYLDVKWIEAYPFTQGSSTFCSTCLKQILTKEDIEDNSGERIRAKFQISEKYGQITDDINELYGKVALRLIGPLSQIPGSQGNPGSKGPGQGPITPGNLGSKGPEQGPASSLPLGSTPNLGSPAATTSSHESGIKRVNPPPRTGHHQPHIGSAQVVPKRPYSLGAAVTTQMTVSKARRGRKCLIM